jgi:hypothetical protein
MVVLLHESMVKLIMAASVISDSFLIRMIFKQF